MVYLSQMDEWMKTVQITLVILGGSCGVLSGLLFGKIGHHFQKNCPLYANVTVTLRINSASTVDRKEAIVEATSVWGDPQTCELVTFEGVLVFINSFIWLWFYLHMENIIRVDVSDTDLSLARKLETHLWSFNFFDRSEESFQRRLKEVSDSRNAIFVLPIIVTKTILCFLSIVRVAYASDGYQHFCFNLCSEQMGIACHQTTENMCRELQYQNWVFLSKQHAANHTFHFHDAMKAALTMSWLEPLLLASHVLIILARVYLKANPPKRATVMPSSSATKQSSPWDVPSSSFLSINSVVIEDNRVDMSGDVCDLVPTTLTTLSEEDFCDAMRSSLTMGADTPSQGSKHSELGSAQDSALCVTLSGPSSQSHYSLQHPLPKVSEPDTNFLSPCKATEVAGRPLSRSVSSMSKSSKQSMNDLAVPSSTAVRKLAPNSHEPTSQPQPAIPVPETRGSSTDASFPGKMSICSSKSASPSSTSGSKESQLVARKRAITIMAVDKKTDI